MLLRARYLALLTATTALTPHPGVEYFDVTLYINNLVCRAQELRGRDPRLTLSAFAFTNETSRFRRPPRSPRIASNGPLRVPGSHTEPKGPVTKTNPKGQVLRPSS